MKVTWGIENVEHVDKTITTVGSFDGLHLGHRDLLQRLEERKNAWNMNRSLVLTFDPHPQQVLRKNDSSVGLLTDIEERLELFSQLSIDEVGIIRFTPQFAQTRYEDFFEHTLVKQIGTAGIVAGYNHAFGHDREGDANNLRHLAKRANVLIEEVGPYIINGVSVSSSKIRHALERHDLTTANAMLGRSYSISGNVISGDGIGKTLGVPTANIQVDSDKLLPADGVYAARVKCSDGDWVAALSIGTRPSIGEDLARAIEVYLLDFEGDLYNRRVQVFCERYIRPQLKFASLDELKSQMEEDIRFIRKETAS